MASKQAEAKATNTETAAPHDAKALATAARRDIPGNLPYLTASGALKKALDRAVEAQRPERFGVDFVENVLKIKGGSGRATIPILKRMGFITSEGVPTELYNRFKTESGRSAAALQGLKTGWAEIFKRSEYAHVAGDDKVKDIIVQITGLPKNDPVTTAIRSTFNVVKSYVSPGTESSSDSAEIEGPPEEQRTAPPRVWKNDPPDESRGIRLAYNINIVLPETSDLSVLNAIFRSIKENLLQ